MINNFVMTTLKFFHQFFFFLETFELCSDYPNRFHCSPSKAKVDDAVFVCVFVWYFCVCVCLCVWSRRHSRWLPLSPDLQIHKLGCNSDNFTNIELRVGVVVAETDSQHII